MKTLTNPALYGKKLSMLFVLLLVTVAARSQDGYNPDAIRPAHKSDMMYKKTVIRAVDLRERQNQPFFAKNREITKLFIEAVRAGNITAYSNDSLNTPLTIDQFNERLKINNGVSFNINNPADTMDAFIQYGPDWRSQIPQEEDYFARDLYQMEIKEDVIFNNQRSRMEYEISAITFYVPADHPSNTRGVQMAVGSFRYKDLVEKVFRNNPNAVSYNMQNEAQHKNLADAFDLRLFSSYIIKVSNAEDAYLSDIYHDQQKGIMASHWAAAELLEYEHNLWEF